MDPDRPGTVTSEGMFVGFVSADHYEKLAARKKRIKAERKQLEAENRLRVSRGLPPLRGQLELFEELFEDTPSVKQGKLF
jgi:hypothetical protein